MDTCLLGFSGLLAEPEITHLPSYDTLYPAPDPPRRHSKLFTSLWTLEKEYWTVYPSTIPTVYVLLDCFNVRD